jgi:hypothetical protein
VFVSANRNAACHDLGMVRTGSAALLLTLGLVACGGGDDDVTKAEWTAAANAVCAEGRAKVEALGPPPVSDFSKLPEFARKAVDIVTEQVRQLRALELPEEDRDQIRDVLDRAEKLADRAKEAGSGAGAIGGLASLQAELQQVQADLAALGPEDCAAQ